MVVAARRASRTGRRLGGAEATLERHARAIRLAAPEPKQAPRCGATARGENRWRAALRIPADARTSVHFNTRRLRSCIRVDPRR
jgi:hypothetical protein